MDCQSPFAAPLAYTGLGLLLIANRLVDPQSPEWAYWILLLALSGFIGNFVFSLTVPPVLRVCAFRTAQVKLFRFSNSFFEYPGQ